MLMCVHHGKFYIVQRYHMQCVQFSTLYKGTTCSVCNFYIVVQRYHMQCVQFLHCIKVHMQCVQFLHCVLNGCTCGDIA